MRVILISPGGTTAGGGMGTVARSIVQALGAEHPHIQVHVLDPRGEGPVLASLPRTVVTLLHFVWLTLSRRADLVHVNLAERLSVPRKSLFIAWAQLLGLPVVAHHHGAEFIEEYDRRGPLYRRLVRWCVHSVDHNLVLGRPWQAFLVERLGVPTDHVSLLYNAIADPGRRPTPEPLRHRPARLVLIANLSPRKGVSELLQAVERLVAEGRDIDLRLLGGGQVARYREEAAARGLAGRCRFDGWVGPATVRQALQEADLFILPSFNEGLPMAILEALGTGVPVVTAPVGSIPEVLADGRTARLVAPGDAEGLARALAGLLDDAAARQSLADQGRHLFEQAFGMSGYIERLLGLYAGLTGSVRVRV